jgi:membrane protease YdiL (CAAX protease family)
VPPPVTPPPGVVGPASVRRRVLRVELAAMAFLAAVPSAVFALRGITDPIEVDLDIPVLELVASLLAALGPAVIAVYLLWRDGRLQAAGFGRRPLSFVAGYGALGALCCFIALWTVAVVVALVVTAAGGDLTVADEDTIELTTGTVVAVVALSLTAGVGEEVVYRAYAISRMEEAGFVRAALWAPWAVFTLEHLYQGPAALLFIGAVGGVFVWLYRWKRSVWPVMAAHALYDIGVLLLAAIAEG